MEIDEIKTFLTINKIKDLDIFFDYETRNLSTFRLNGKCPVFIIANSEDALLSLLSFLEGCSAGYYIIGRGSNTLIGDCSKTVVIKLGKNFDYVEFDDDNGFITAGASCNLGKFIIKCAKKRYDFSFLAGIPGTVGGAVFGNCGNQVESLCDYIESIECIRILKNKILKENLKIFKYGYRFLKIDNMAVITRVFLKKDKMERELIYNNIKENILKKKNSQPLNSFNCGCFFKNPLNSKKTAGALIDSLGLKGFSYGGASVSIKHANFIENRGNAMPEDIYNLVKIIAGLVNEKFRIKLEYEVKLVGFEK